MVRIAQCARESIVAMLLIWLIAVVTYRQRRMSRDEEMHALVMPSEEDPQRSVDANRDQDNESAPADLETVAHFRSISANRAPAGELRAKQVQGNRDGGGNKRDNPNAKTETNMGEDRWLNTSNTSSDDQ